VKVLIIPEDQQLDRYIVQPVVEALFDDLGLRARVEVLPEPRLHGAAEALDADIVREIVTTNPMVDLFLLVVDRDCDREGNSARASARQAEHPGRLIACVALQEIEVWMLALYKDDLDVGFAEVRAECDPKERWAEPLLERLGLGGPGRGRKHAMRRLKGAWRSLSDISTELRDLQRAIGEWRSARTT
jgi:hypothetical protein